jgi:uncharacterized protein YndB with AHSA1/START domain
MFDFPALYTVDGQELAIERQLAAPRTLMFQMFTQPKQLKHCRAPGPDTLPVCTLDLQCLS